MPREQDRFVQQREEYVVNRRFQLGEIAVREVGSANASGENHIASKHQWGGKGLQEIHDVPRRMPGRLPDQKIAKHYSLEKGSPAFIFSGKNVGAKGRIKEVKTRKSMTEKSTVAIRSEDKEIETLKDYVFVGETGDK